MINGIADEKLAKQMNRAILKRAFEAKGDMQEVSVAFYPVVLVGGKQMKLRGAGKRVKVSGLAAAEVVLEAWREWGGE